MTLYHHGQPPCPVCVQTSTECSDQLLFCSAGNPVNCHFRRHKMYLGNLFAFYRCSSALMRWSLTHRRCVCVTNYYAVCNWGIFLTVNPFSLSKLSFFFLFSPSPQDICRHFLFPHLLFGGLGTTTLSILTAIFFF